jgi:hypothetical protein
MKYTVLILFCVVLLGCKKASVEADPIVEQPKTYTATLIVRGVGEEKTEVTNGLKAGDIKSFKVVEYPDYTRTSVVIDDISQPAPFLESYEIKVTSRNLRVVFEFLENRVLALTTVPIYMKKKEQQETQTGQGIWVKMTPDPRELTDYKVFQKDGIYFEYDVNRNPFGGPFKWYFTEKGLVVGSIEYLSITLNTDGTIIVTYMIPVLGLPGKTVNMRETWGAVQGSL